MTERTQGRGAIIVISGPSGSGKTTMVRRILSDDPTLMYSVSATTRPPRAGEVQGRDYWFLTREEFQRRIAAGEFAEHAESFGNLYGTPAGPMFDAIEKGRVFVLDIDVQGARQIRNKFPEAVLVFIRPPDAKTLERRLRKRKSETAEQLRLRLKRAEEELGCAGEYDYVIVNDGLEQAVSDLTCLIHRLKETQGGKRG
jgi:guanylate kinase